MRAVVITSPGDPDVLRIEERPAPIPGGGEVLIRVGAAGVNRPDVIQRQGRYPAPPGVPDDIPGLEVAGIIEATGDEVQRWKPGDRVCALVAGGGYAEYVSVPAVQCLPVPDGWDMIMAASVPETFFTVWTNVFQRCGFKQGESVLVHGGTSGIGVAAIQMVKAMGGRVAVTAGTEEKCRFAEGLGADRAINYREEDFEGAVREEFGGVDIILDMIGGDYAPKNIRCLNEEGRIAIINAMGGREATVDLMRIMVKRLIVTGSTLRSRNAEFKGKIASELEAHIWPLIQEAHIKPVIYKTFPLEEAAEAHRLMESGRHIGKIVLTVSNS